MWLSAFIGIYVLYYIIESCMILWIYKSIEIEMYNEKEKKKERAHYSSIKHIAISNIIN